MRPEAHAYAGAELLGAAPAAMHGAGERGRAVYRSLTGRAPEHVGGASEEEFDAHVLASIIAVAATEGGRLAERVGLPPCDLLALVARWFPQAELAWSSEAGAATHTEDDELVMVRDLLMANCWSGGETGRWLAHMIARRAMEPSHLWEDLGLRSREELSRLLVRHFAPLAARNTRGMRWKRFFYRVLCEEDGLVMCTTPVCTECCDFDSCFGVEDGEGRLARRKREAEAAPPGRRGPGAGERVVALKVQ